MSQSTWQAALTQLQSQMTRATFEHWLQGTTVLEEGNGLYRIAVKSEQAQEWLQNRLHDTVQRTLTSLTGEAVTVEFVVAPFDERSRIAAQDTANCPPEPEPPPENGSMPPTSTETPSLEAPISSPLTTVDYQQLWNSTGFIKLDHYANTFWRRYLGRAFDLWLYLQARPMSREYLAQGWTPSKKFRFRELARAMKASPNSIKGAEENCYYLRLAADLGQPLTECSGRFQEVRWEPGPEPRCLHWRTGWLEILFAEKLLAVEEVKSPDKPRSHSLKLQVWRILPLLTPFQVSRLSESEQEQHDRWLEQYSHLVTPAVTVEAWEAETVHSFVPLMTSPPYDLGRTNFDIYQPNTLKEGYCIYEDAMEGESGRWQGESEANNI